MPHLRLTLCVAVLLVGRTGSAQEFSVYTGVFDESAATDGSRGPVARSLSLFRAGQAYDYIEGAQQGEVIIFEPALERFRILNTTHAIWTTVHFDQLNHKLKLARQVSERHLDALQERQPAPAGLIAEVAFTLHPSFQETFDSPQRLLTLTSPLVTYRVTCARPEAGHPSPEHVETYLRYTDAIARMNYVLHPHALGPELRLALNQALRRRQVIPVEVALHAQVAGEVTLRAEHKFRWTLEARDRSLIHEWESLLSDGQFQHVTLDEYQRVLFGAHGSTRQAASETPQ